MYCNAFLTKLVTSQKPLETILDWLVSTTEPFIDLNDILASYDQIEGNLRDFEYWLHKVWGLDFYNTLLGTEDEWAKIIRWGTDGIQTDNPEKLINYLNNK